MKFNHAIVELVHTNVCVRRWWLLLLFDSPEKNMMLFLKEG